MDRLFSGLRNLLARVLVVALLLGVVWGASKLWRRAIYRYVHDVRRRSQLLWVRRFVMWFTVGMIIAFSFVSQLGSIATFAGLITAGVAFALQNVIQSLAGYFFLIGKYGIRGGDRVQIGGVNGEVIDVGLVRIHLMEMGGAAADTPTGRVVAFSNSIVFQPTAGLFKQIPGTSFAWHEITLTLAPDTNMTSLRERLLKSVETGLADYKDEIARQHSAMEDTLESTPGIGLEPIIQLRYTTAGIEALVRYPVSLRHASEIDERVTRAVFSDFNLGRSAGSASSIRTTSAAD
jgi:small-conductance mechanosensitive channel